MTITFQDGELRQLLREHTQTIQPGLLAHEQDQTLIYPSWLGSGHKRDIELPSGISLTLHQYQLNQELVNVCQANPSACFEFVFSLTTEYIYNEHQRLGQHQAYLIGPSDQEERWLELSGEDYLSVDVHLDLSLMAVLFESYEAVLPNEIRRILTGDWPGGQDLDHCVAIAFTAMTPAIELALQQILQCPFRGVTQELYLEAKSLELIALFIEALQATPLAPVHLNRDDCDRLHQARQILRENLQTPPPLIHLARQVGLNDRKLKEGFRQVFNTTVFGYLTQQRLEKACQLLAQQYSVATVASAVGYTSPTAFSGAFRRQFGISPKQYQLGQRVMTSAVE